MNKRGFFFTVDIILAIVVFIVGFVLVYASSVSDSTLVQSSVIVDDVLAQSHLVYDSLQITPVQDAVDPFLRDDGGEIIEFERKKTIGELLAQIYDESLDDDGDVDEDSTAHDALEDVIKILYTDQIPENYDYKLTLDDFEFVPDGEFIDQDDAQIIIVGEEILFSLGKDGSFHGPYVLKLEVWR